MDRQERPSGRTVRAWLFWFAAAVGLVAAGPAMAACSAPATLNDSAGVYSPATVAAGTTGYIAAPGGFTCTSGNILTLLGNNYLRVTVTGTSVMALSSGVSGAPAVPVSLALAASGSPQLTPGNTVYLINGTLVNLLGLLGSGPMNVPVYIKPGAVSLPAGVYKGVITLRWEWRFCSAIEVAGNCTLLGGTLDAGSQNTAITFTLTVANQPTIVINAATTWDPVGKTSVPKVLPGARMRLNMQVTNPNPIALDTNQLVLVLPTPTTLAVALDGDGTGQGAVVQTTQGATGSTLALSYTAPNSTGDDVDFSSQSSGDDWSYYPTAGDPASQGAVKRVRFRPRGAMAAGSSYTISLPYSVQ